MSKLAFLYSYLARHFSDEMQLYVDFAFKLIKFSRLFTKISLFLLLLIAKTTHSMLVEKDYVKVYAISFGIQLGHVTK